MKLKEKIKILYAMLMLIEDYEEKAFLCFAILRYIAGWGEVDFNDALKADAFEDIKDFLGEME